MTGVMMSRKLPLLFGDLLQGTTFKVYISRDLRASEQPAVLQSLALFAASLPHAPLALTDESGKQTHPSLRV